MTRLDFELRLRYHSCNTFVQKYLRSTVFPSRCEWNHSWALRPYP
jgi:hypothetical protein